MSSGHEADPNRVAGGLKATVHNPNISQQTKSRAEDRLREMGVPDADSSALPKDNGAKGSDEYVPDEEEEEFEDTGSSRLATGEDKSGSEHNRVMGGYKATLKNPRVSKEAKTHAEEVLRDNDAI